MEMCLWFGAKRDGLCPISLRADNLDNDPTHLKVPRVFFAAWLSSVISVKSRREREQEIEWKKAEKEFVILFVKIATHKHGRCIALTEAI